MPNTPFNRLCNTRHGWLMVPLAVGLIGLMVWGIAALAKALI